MLPKKLLSFLIISIVLSACDGSDESKTQETHLQETKQLSNTDIVKASSGSLYKGISFTGTLNPLNSVSISTEVSGTAQKVYTREGESVQKGQLLAVLDSETLQQSVSEQAAQLANTRSSLKLAQIKLYQQKELYKQGFISKLAYDEALSAYNISQGTFNAQAASLAKAKKSLSDTNIKAPISGTLYQKHINPGEVINPGTMIFAVADLNILEIEATIPSQQISLIRVGQEATFKVDGYAQLFSGKITRINPVANDKTRTFTIYIEVINHDLVLKAGQFAQGDIILTQVDHAILVPLNAIQMNEKNQRYVMLIQNNVVKHVPIQLLLINESSRMAAIKGIPPNSILLSASLLGIQSGSKVTIPALEGN